MGTSVGQKVRAVLAERGISQERAAEALSLSQSQVSRRLDGQIDFKVTELTRLASLCGVPVADFLPVAERVA